MDGTPDPAANGRTDGDQAIAIVDAFTAEPFAGNPAGVCVLAGPTPETWMQLVARELNLSETAFVHREATGYRLRWFTPASEVELCGHATMATAHLLWEDGLLGPDEVARFHTLSGELGATRSLAGDGSVWIEIDLPALALTPADPPPGLLEALGVLEPLFVGRSGDDYVVRVASDVIVRGLTPDFTRLKALDARTVAVTAAVESDGADAGPWVDAAPGSTAGPTGSPAVVSRFFGPKVGVAEDPVTGFAHCLVAPWWCEMGVPRTFLAYQASARGGYLRVTVDGDRVRLAGQAVTVLRGRLLVAP